MDVTLFASSNSITGARLHAVCPEGYEENKSIDAKLWECVHILECFEQAPEFDIIHSQFIFLPLTYSKLTGTPVVTTIRGFSFSRILPVYRKYNRHTYYVSISNVERSPELDDYVLYYGRIHHDKGTKEAVEIALPLAGQASGYSGHHSGWRLLQGLCQTLSERRGN